ncbi:MAG TPA: PAS domain S-box protein [Ktedonobacteraceae bacterium]|nr:PAS domain S-box protein [Ktedonobacteraceae bacterium]
MPEPLEAPHPLAFASEHLTFSSLHQLLDLLPDAMVVVNQEGTMVLVNKQSEVLFGYARSELLTQPLEILLPERFRGGHIRRREQYAAAPRARPMGIGLQLFGRKKDGSEFPVDISLGPLSLDDRPHVVAAIRDVTEQRRLERERLQQTQRIRLQAELINQAHDAILVRDPISRVLSWNRGAEQLYGWTAQEALGRISSTLLKTRFPLSLAALDAQLKEEGVWEGELIHTCRDGRTVIVESRQVLVRDEEGQPTAILEINRDVTKRHREEQASQIAHTTAIARLQFFQQILDTLPTGVCLTYGPDARLLLANQAAGSVWKAHWQTDQPMLEFLAMHQIELATTQGGPLPPEQFVTLRALRQGETALYQQEMIHYADGSRLSVLVNAISLSSLPPEQASSALPVHHLPANEALALTIYQDVTPLKEAEYLKDEFIGIAAHELRTPLAVLQGYADTLLVQTARGHGMPLAQWQKEALEEIKQATTRMTALTEDLLDVTRLQAGRLRLQRSTANVVSLVQRVVAHVQQTTTRHQIALHAKQQELMANIDPGRIEQVVTNLLDNAVKYSPQGGPITIMLREDAGTQTMWITVQDQGIGIPSHQQAQIFGRFMRATNAQAWGIQGTGLGLHLSRELVEQHGGRLWFESKEDTGTTFFLTLPLACSQVKDSGALLEQESGEAP